MYLVKRTIDPKYGNIVEIQRLEEGGLESPFWAVDLAKKERRLWKEEGSEKVRYLVDRQILATSALQKWAKEEYESLPKCGYCAKILSGEVFNNALSPDKLFCTQSCTDKDYQLRMDYLTDHEECDI